MEEKVDLALRHRLPDECWAHIIEFLPRISRQSLSLLYGFQELVDDTTQLEDRRLYQALKNGNLRWSKVTGKSMQPRLRHGTINFFDELIIFGGASGYLPTSGTYNDVWMFDFVKRFQRMSTLGPEIPSPRANFGYIRAGERIFAVGGTFDPFLAHLNPFEVYMLNPKAGSWQKVITTGNEPQHSVGARCALLSQNELIVVTGLIPMIHNWMQEVVPEEGNYEHLRTSMQVSILKFSDSSMERGTWFRLADWNQTNRRGLPPPRAEFHLVKLENDNVMMIGGCSTILVIQDVWIMSVTRNPTYSVKFTQIAISNPFVPSLPLHLFPSCLIGDLLVFTGVRTILKKPGGDKPKEEPKKVQETPPSTPSPSVPERRTPIFINLERPVNTIGAMAAFSVSSQPAVPPQKVLRIQIAPDPSPEPQRRPQRHDFPMRIFCLDLSGIMGLNRPNPTIRWLEMKNGGLFPGAPELRAHGTFTQFENGIILIGGVRRTHTTDNNLCTQATNEVYILDYVVEERLNISC